MKILRSFFGGSLRLLKKYEEKVNVGEAFLIKKVNGIAYPLLAWEIEGNISLQSKKL